MQELTQRTGMNTDGRVHTYFAGKHIECAEYESFVIQQVSLYGDFKDYRVKTGSGVINA
jgi:hypothetical protein